MARPFRILSVAGARPNFVKMAPILTELRRYPEAFTSSLVHTGQHYDEKLSHVFFDELAIPRPDVNLNVGSGSHAQQTAAIMSAFEPALVESRADLVVVLGDVNSTLACALVAAKLGIPVAHVEAGLRSFDRTMPEEINRVLTDQISDVLFTTEESAEGNLRREGVDPSTIHFVGNVMIDSLLAHRARAQALNVAQKFSLTPRAYVVLTLHRPSNVDEANAFERLVGALETVSRDMPVVFPVHPRARAAVDRSSRLTTLIDEGRLKLIDPLGYLDFIGLMDSSFAVLTDSGGLQEETTILGVPCLTLRENTERPVTITVGTNRLVGNDPKRIVQGWLEIKENRLQKGSAPPLWDGKAAQRIVEVIRQFAADRRKDG